MTGIGAAPWVVKPLYGFLSDTVPIFGYRRRSYLIICGLLGRRLSPRAPSPPPIPPNPAIPPARWVWLPLLFTFLAFKRFSASFPVCVNLMTRCKACRCQVQSMQMPGAKHADAQHARNAMHALQSRPDAQHADALHAGATHEGTQHAGKCKACRRKACRCKACRQLQRMQAVAKHARQIQSTQMQSNQMLHIDWKARRWRACSCIASRATKMQAQSMQIPACTVQSTAHQPTCVHCWQCRHSLMDSSSHCSEHTLHGSGYGRSGVTGNGMQ